MSDPLRPHELYSPWNSQARILEWVAYLFSGGSSQPRDQTQVSHIAAWFFTWWATREALELEVRSQNLHTWVWEFKPSSFSSDILSQNDSCWRREWDREDFPLMEVQNIWEMDSLGGDSPVAQW